MLSESRIIQRILTRQYGARLKNVAQCGEKHHQKRRNSAIGKPDKQPAHERLLARECSFEAFFVATGQIFKFLKVIVCLFNCKMDAVSLWSGSSRLELAVFKAAGITILYTATATYYCN